MAAARVLRLRRTDQTTEHLLLNVTQTHKSRPLDLKLIATDEEHLYHATVRTAELDSLQSSHFDGNSDQWREVLSYALLQTEPKDSLSDLFTGLEAAAAISGEKAIITIRKNIGGITRRLGSIELVQDDGREEVSFFEWVDITVAASDDLRNNLAKMQASMKSQQDTVARLTAQLDDLVKEKKSHDEELLRKFAALLNTKKLKIRDQQRLLNTKKIGSNVAAPDATDPVEEPKGGSARRKPGVSGSAKRKANAPVAEEDMEDGTETDPDDDALAIQEEEAQKTDSATETEESDDDGFAPAPAASQQSTGGRARAAAEKSKSKQGSSRQDVEPVTLPPPRELPFARKSQPAKQPTPAANADGDDDETDDEL